MPAPVMVMPERIFGNSAAVPESRISFTLVLAEAPIGKGAEVPFSHAGLGSVVATGLLMASSMVLL